MTGQIVPYGSQGGPDKCTNRCPGNKGQSCGSPDNYYIATAYSLSMIIYFAAEMLMFGLADNWLGCYGQYFASPTLDHQQSTLSPVTPQLCIDQCKSKFFAYLLILVYTSLFLDGFEDMLV